MGSYYPSLSTSADRCYTVVTNSILVRDELGEKADFISQEAGENTGYIRDKSQTVRGFCLMDRGSENHQILSMSFSQIIKLRY